MKKAIFILILSVLYLFMADNNVQSAHWAGNLSGYILLQTEKNGEAWYVYPATGKRYYLGRPADGFELMKKLSLGANSDYIARTVIFPDRLSGLILLDVGKNGEAYYIYPADKKKYYLGRPADAFRIMRELGRGIANADLINIPEGNPDEKPASLPIASLALLDVPFTSQAPFGNWSDQRQQDGCEESTALMAMKWARHEKLTKAESEKAIIDTSDFLLKKYGEYRDISPADMVKWIFNDYYNYRKVFLVKNITVNDIINELSRGRLIITPMNGQIMHNPYYKIPGPPRHMIVIRGYDPAAKKFITNDPGTRNGELYRYDAQTLFAAIRDYPTGYHETIYKIEKTMLVVEK
jgi:hypothetical protein